jgi:hypothetical protein
VIGCGYICEKKNFQPNGGQNYTLGVMDLYVVAKINDNAYKLDLSGEYNVSATFNVSYLSPFNVSNSRMNPFEERGNDEDQQDQQAHDDHGDLHIPIGPITRAQAKKIKEAMLWLVRDVFEQGPKSTITLSLKVD